MIKTYINGRFLSQKMTGQQRFSRELVTAIDRWLDNHPQSQADYQFSLLVPRNAELAMNLRHIPIRKVGVLRGHLWDQIDLPLHTSDGVLLSLCGVGPVLHPRHVITLHDAAPFANPSNFKVSFRLVYSVLVPTLAKVASEIITVSQFSKSELSRYCGVRPDKVHVVANGADHILSVPGEPSVIDAYGLAGKRYVFALGSHSVNKNFRLVVEAFRRLQRDDLTLVVAGGQNSSVFANYDIDEIPNLVRLGYVSDRALRTLYENALCFVLPSLYEGFGIPPLEAMLCGCPVIVSTAPALVETCGSAALACDPHNPADLAEQIIRIADDHALRELLRERGYQRARLFTWDASAERIIDLLQWLGRDQRQKVATVGHAI